MPRYDALPRARRELERLGQLDRARVLKALAALEAGNENLDVVALEGCRPWLRLRAGNHRIIFRTVQRADGNLSFLIARIVDRKDLIRAVRQLGKN